MSANKIEIDASVARIVLDNLDLEIEIKTKERDGLESEIDKLLSAKKSLQYQLNGKPSEAVRAPTGDNRSRIKEFLLKVGSNKSVKASEIMQATGIGSSSVAYTLNAYPRDFEQNADTKLWKLTLVSSVTTP